MAAERGANREFDKSIPKASKPELRNLEVSMPEPAKKSRMKSRPWSKTVRDPTRHDQGAGERSEQGGQRDEVEDKGWETSGEISGLPCRTGSDVLNHVKEEEALPNFS